MLTAAVMCDILINTDFWKERQILMAEERICRERAWLPWALFALCIIQPLMDVLSYWLIYFDSGELVKLTLRFAVFGVVFIAAFCISRRKKIYLIFVGASAVFIAAHAACCFHAVQGYGMSSALNDTVNFIRVLQLPAFTMAFIAFFRESDRCFDYTERGVAINFWIIAAVELVSVVTNTNPYTYDTKQIGVLGWFYATNSQSAVVCAVIPWAMYEAWKRDGENGFPWRFAAASAAGAAVLYFFATRLAFLGIFVILGGMFIVLLVNKKLGKRRAAVLIVCMLLCAGTIKLSPMHENQSQHAAILASEQADIDSLVAQDKAKYGDAGYMYLEGAYTKYLGGLVDRFGLERVAAKYGGSTDAGTVINIRSMKINYCSLLMEDYPAATKVFGMPLDQMTYKGTIYDVENDWYGIYFLYGFAGLALLAAFILYFLVIVAKALIDEFGRYFTPESGAAGIALVMLLIHSVFTDGVLRRPNASFYLSVCLAAAYYIVNNVLYGE
jgi:hypothetical protein